MIKYLGSKRRLVGKIAALVGADETATSVLDLFSGTARVGHALKAAGYRVIANDHNAYAHVLGRCYVQADREDVEIEASRVLADLRRARPRAGWFTHTYCERARYFQPHNGERIEGIRERIAELGLRPDVEAVALVSLMEAADRVDSTTGVQMAYLKGWAPRSFGELELRMPRVLPRARHGRGAAHGLDAETAVGMLEADVAYLDPPYNQHSYLGNYHVWETLVRWDTPATYGVACKRTDVRERRSAFNLRGSFAEALRRVVAKVRARTLVVSFSDESWVSAVDLEALLRDRAEDVAFFEVPYDRYVGAKIGIYNARGERVGTPGRLRNVERLFVAGRSEVVDRARAIAASWSESRQSVLSFGP
jgi:adenine-specific DNA-methyltransferase